MKIIISEKAQAIIKKQLEDKNREMGDTFLRIFVKGIGWGGPTFGIALEEQKNEEKDYDEEINGLKLLVEKDLLDQYKSFKVDYSDGWFRKGFSIQAGIGGSGC